MKKRKKQKKITIFHILFRIAPMVFRTSPISFLYLGVTLMHGFSWAFLTKVQQNFFDSAAGMLDASHTISQVLCALGLLAGIQIATQVLNGVDNLIPMILDRKIAGVFSKSIHEKIARLSPILFEDTVYLDDISKAEEGKDSAMNVMWFFISLFFSYTPYFLYMGWYLFTLKPILVISIVIAFIPTALSQLMRTRLFTHLEEETAPLRRQYEHYENCMVGREYFKETRLLGGFRFFKQLYLSVLNLMQKKRYKAQLRADLAELGVNLLSVLGYITIIYLLFVSLMKQEISIGAFAAVFASINFLFGIMREVVCYRITDVAQGLGAARNYLRFLDLPEITGTLEKPKNGDIVLENVSFRYPHQENIVIDQVSFSIRRGETIALVGENGSGKSTLVRLITGLYLPEKGHVLHGGISTAKIAPNALYADISAVFQKYQRYQMTLDENTTISEIGAPILDTKRTIVQQQAGIDIENAQTFPDHGNTMLSREFDGVDLSGGQWQRVAIARGLYRTHNLIVLDEPTAAIDPYEETRVYNRFAEISADKTAIIVTHRLGSVKLADRIIVLKDGKVVQIGTHDELVKLPGEYQTLYLSQLQWYENHQEADNE